MSVYTMAYRPSEGEGISVYTVAYRRSVEGESMTVYTVAYWRSEGEGMTVYTVADRRSEDKCRIFVNWIVQVAVNSNMMVFKMLW